MSALRTRDADGGATAGNGQAKLVLAPPFMIVSRHDYRTSLQVNLHHCAPRLLKYGSVRFVSVGFSMLSWGQKDIRLPLWSQSNRRILKDGVECFLWRTLVHPFNLRKPVLDGLSATWFAGYARRLPPVFLSLVKTTRTIIIESGLPVMLFEAIKRANPRASIVYFASDDLATIGCAPAIVAELNRTAHRYDAVFSPSKWLARQFPESVPKYQLPYGIDPAHLELTGLSPYPGGLNAATAGSSAFDPEFFKVAAPAFRNVTFHLIGCGPKADLLSFDNVRIYPSLPFKTVMSYFAAADIGVAPYATGALHPYHAESSQKLNQFAMLGIPAVCPTAAVGDSVGRFAYDPDKPETIVRAIEQALACRRLTPRPALSWDQIVERMVDPDGYPDIRV